eukprot:jgi/Picre1/34250/NNA_001724.t1
MHLHQPRHFHRHGQKYSTWGRFSGVTECVVDVGRWVSPGARDSRCDSRLVRISHSKNGLRRMRLPNGSYLHSQKRGRYNKDNRNIDSRWKEAFIEGSEKISGKPNKVTTSREAAAIQKVRKKCTSKGWNFERVYKILVPHGDLDRLCGPEKAKHSNPTKEPSERQTHTVPNCYKGSRGNCTCQDGLMPIMVQEVFPHDGPLQRVGGQTQDDLSTKVIEVNKPVRWHESLVRVAPEENIRAKSIKKTSKSNKENTVRQSTRTRQISGIFREILNIRGKKNKYTPVAGKRGRKKNGGAKGPVIQASKPETEVVERPGKRRTTKITIGK